MDRDEVYLKIKRELDLAVRPLFFYDYDVDGFMSFLQFRKYKSDGKGVYIKSGPEVTVKYLEQVKKYSPDVVFVLDMPHISDEFFKKVKAKIIWIDHHDLSVKKKNNLIYYNPKQFGEDKPTSQIVYEILNVNEDLSNYLWYAMVGIVGDWHLPDELTKEFVKRYPSYLSLKISKPDDALFESQLGSLIRIISFGLKEKSKVVSKLIESLIKIKHPDEIMTKSSKEGKFIYKKYSKYIDNYLHMIDSIKPNVDDNVLFFEYSPIQTSFTVELANEIYHRYPDKTIIIARKSDGKYKCSLRSKHNLPKILDKIFISISGYGGGHKNASGAVFNIEDKDIFLKIIRENID